MSGTTSFTTITDQIAQDVLKKLDFYAEARFDQTIVLEKSSIDYEVLGASENQPKSHLQLLLGVFVGLIGVLAVVAFTANRPQPQTTQSEALESQIVAPTVALFPSGLPTAQPTLPPLDSFSIRIFNGSGKPGQAETIRTLLAEKGFTSATIGNASGRISRTEIVFQSSVPQEVRRQFVESLSTIITDPAILENDEAAEKIVVTTGSP